MALPGSGTISMKDILDEKQGATTARTDVSLKGLSVDGVADSSGGDISGTPDGNAPYAMSEFHGYSQVTDTFPDTTNASNWFELSGLGGEAPSFLWGNVSRTGSESSVQVSCQVGFKNDTSNSRIVMQEGNGNSGTGTSLNLHYLGYSGHSSTTFQAKCVYTTPSGGSSFGVTKQSPASFSPASGTYASLSTSSFSPLWLWSITNTGFSPASITSSSPHPRWFLRAGTSGSDDTDGPGTGNAIALSAQRGSSGGGPGGGGDICIHEDHKISTQDGLLTIDELIDKCPKVWSWNNTSGQKELVDLASIRKVKHDNLYTINNIKVTEDHVLYKENYTPVSVNPTKAKENYDIDSTEIQVGDKLMKFDGTLEEVTSIAVLDGEHMTYTILNKNGNFYAEEYLVDTEIKEAKYY